MTHRFVRLAVLIIASPLLFGANTSALVAPRQPLSVSGLSVKNVTATSATVVWTTSVPATSEVDYGPTTGYGLTAANGAYTTIHSMALTSPVLVGGTTYHFKVRSADKLGDATNSDDELLTTLGADITVQVTNSDAQPVTGATVSWNGQSTKTDATGSATLLGLPAGDATVVVQSGKLTATRLITTAADGSAQTVDVALPALPTTFSWMTPALSVLLILAAGAAGFVLGRRGTVVMHISKAFTRIVTRTARPKAIVKPSLKDEPRGTEPAPEAVIAVPAAQDSPIDDKPSRRYSIDLKDLRSRLR